MTPSAVSWAPRWITCLWEISFLTKRNNLDPLRIRDTMRKEWLLTLAVTLITIVITVTSLRYYAPQLLGIPADLQLVQVSKEVVPFFDGIFREEDRKAENV